MGIDIVNSRLDLEKLTAVVVVLIYFSWFLIRPNLPETEVAQVMIVLFSSHAAFTIRYFVICTIYIFRRGDNTQAGTQRK